MSRRGLALVCSGGVVLFALGMLTAAMVWEWRWSGLDGDESFEVTEIQEVSENFDGGNANKDEDWPLRARMRRLAAEKLPAPFEKLKPNHKLMARPQPGEWLAEHEENGRSFAGYKRCKPVRPGKTYKKIYIQPVGAFTKDQDKIVKLAAEYMQLYFMTPVVIKPLIPLKNVPADAKRQRFGTTQILSTWVMDKILRPRRPKDALAYIAFTSNDLWPGKGWNFVFGQASLRSRVGVWSIYRNGNPSDSAQMFRTCLVRTIKTATHETGHILTMYHCIAYECNMNGSNHREESDKHPLALGPVCHAKLVWNAHCDPAKRLKGLVKFCEREKLKDETAVFKKSLAIVEKQKK